MRPALALPVLAALLLAQPAAAQVAAPDSGDTGWMIACALLLLLRRAAGPDAASCGACQCPPRACRDGPDAGRWRDDPARLGYCRLQPCLCAGQRMAGRRQQSAARQSRPLRDGLTVPESAFVLFQMGFAVLAGAISVGAIAGRARLGWVAAFAPLWLLLVFAPITHWMWGGGWLAQLGAMDFAGGLVVHVLAGFSALALALVAGRPAMPRVAAMPISSPSPAVRSSGSAMPVRSAAGRWAPPTMPPPPSSTSSSPPAPPVSAGHWSTGCSAPMPAPPACCPAPLPASPPFPHRPPWSAPAGRC